MKNFSIMPGLRTMLNRKTDTIMRISGLQA